MSRFALPATILLLGALLGQSAIADEYTVAVGTPQTGTSIPPVRVGLGIPVSVNKSWSELSGAEKQAWRVFTDFLDANVTPPFPLPNIRGFLKKLEALPQYETGLGIERRDEIYLIVRVSETGDVNTVDIMRGAGTKATELSDTEKVLAYRFINALTTTKFSPAKVDGTAVASAFPMLIRSLRVLR